METGSTTPGEPWWPTLVQAAVAYGARGWSVIPLQKTQSRLLDWRPYQTQRASEQQIRWWFIHPWDHAGVGIVCGPVSHGLAVVEIVDPQLAERLMQERVGHLTRAVRTPNQGLHLYVCGTTTPTQTGPLIPNVVNLKGTGAYVIAPPSTGYTVITEEPILEVPDVKAWALALLAQYGVGVDEPQQQAVIDVSVNGRPLHNAQEKPPQQSTPSSPEAKIAPVQHSRERDDGDFCPISLGHFTTEPKPRIEIVERLMPEGYPTILYGDGGVGKSYLALGIATCVATGQPFVGLAVRSSGVLFLDWELDSAEFQRRGFAVARGLRLPCPPANLYYAPMARPFSTLVDRVHTFINQKEIGLVILDSLGMACAGDPELARDVIGFFTLLRHLGITVLAIDHQAKLLDGQSYASKSPFGSVFKSNLSRSLIQVERLSGHDGWLSLRLHHKKLTFGALSHTLGVTLQFDTSEGAETVRMSTWAPTQAPAASERLSDQEKIERSLQQEGPATNTVLAQRTGVNLKTTSNHVARLHQTGKIKKAGNKGRAVIWAWVGQATSVPQPGSTEAMPPDRLDVHSTNDAPSLDDAKGQTNATTSSRPNA